MTDHQDLLSPEMTSWFASAVPYVSAIVGYFPKLQRSWNTYTETTSLETHLTFYFTTLENHFVQHTPYPYQELQKTKAIFCCIKNCQALYAQNPLLFEAKGFRQPVASDLLDRIVPLLEVEYETITCFPLHLFHAYLYQQDANAGQEFKSEVESFLREGVFDKVERVLPLLHLLTQLPSNRVTSQRITSVFMTLMGPSHFPPQALDFEHK